jgi:hypothetical protein
MGLDALGLGGLLQGIQTKTERKKVCIQEGRERTMSVAQLRQILGQRHITDKQMAKAHNIAFLRRKKIRDVDSRSADSNEISRNK